MASQLPRICLFVGETGAGKSSIIKGLLKLNGIDESRNVIVSHSDLSCTQESTKWDSGRRDVGDFMDTRGTDDSKRDTTDKDLLHSPMRAINELGTTVEMRVVWCTKAQNRRVGSLQEQAEFIQSIFESFDVGWDSVMIVIQRGDSAAHVNAVIGAAEQYGCRDGSIVERVVMGDVIDWGDGRDAIRQTKNEALRPILTNSDMMEKLHVWTEDAFLGQILDTVVGMRPATINFRNVSCRKCGQEGDERFFVDLCHGDMERVHCTQIASRHHGDPVLRRRHGTKTTTKHRFIRRRHKGRKRTHGTGSRRHGRIRRHHGRVNKHAREEKYHTGYLQSYHYGSRRNKYITESERYVRSYTYYHYGTYIPAYLLVYGFWNCCGRHGRSSRGCRRRSNYDYRDVERYVGEEYTCCYQSASSSGCRKRWSCCHGSPSSSGCRDRCSNCRKSPSSTDGCVCNNCGKIASSGYCTETCLSCQRDASRSWCKYSCGCDRGTEGCQEVCVGCNSDIQSNGCVGFCRLCGRTSEQVDLSTTGCETFCNEPRCGKKVTTVGCIKEYYCARCNLKFGDQSFCTFECCDGNKGSVGCREVCGLCKMGILTAGCEVVDDREEVQHDTRPLSTR